MSEESRSSRQPRPWALELRGIAKRFGEVIALDSADLQVAQASVHALLGENGAGKTTLVRIAYGAVPKDAGEISFHGDRVMSHSVRTAIRARMGMVHQHLSLVPNLSVLENLALGGNGGFRRRETEKLLERIAAASGLDVPHDALVRELSIVEQQRLEILKALSRGVQLLILDEPTAILAPSEIEDLLRWIREFARRGGSIVFVTHKLREALAVADDITVLRRGRTVLSRQAHAVTEQELASAIFGERQDVPTVVPTTVPSSAVRVRAKAIDVLDARGNRRIRNASLQLHAGEIVGIAAVEGSGHRDLLLALAGLTPISDGFLELPPRIGVIPGDRQHEGLIPAFTLTENVALHQLGQRRGRMPWRTLAGRTAVLLERFNIVAPSVRVAAGTLSGGNQQRLVVARELEHDVALLVADNPTRGLDNRAAAFVHHALRQAATCGATVVVHSSDLDEILMLATRMLVVFHGSLREVPMQRELIGRAMLGAE